MIANIIDEYQYTKGLSEKDKKIIKKELFVDNEFQFKIKVIYIGEDKNR